jgi:hypothetical protein
MTSQTEALFLFGQQILIFRTVRGVAFCAVMFPESAVDYRIFNQIPYAVMTSEADSINLINQQALSLANMSVVTGNAFSFFKQKMYKRI